jgi:peroxin-3
VPPPSPPIDPSNPAQSPSDVSIAPLLRRLLDETSDLIDSPTFTHVLTLLLDSSFSHLIDLKIATQAYKIPPPPSTLFTHSQSQPQARVQDVTDTSTTAQGDIKVRVASLLPVFCQQAHAITYGDGDSDSFDNDFNGLLQQSPSPPSPTQGNEYLAAMETVRDLEAFAAVVYSSNFEYEAVDAEEQKRQSALWDLDSKRVSSIYAVDSKRVSQIAGDEGSRPVSGVGEGLLSGAGFESAWRRALGKEQGGERA